MAGLPGVDVPVRCWRTKSGLECDFILGPDGEVAIGVKGGSSLRPREFKPIRAYMDEHRPRQAIIVCNENAPRRTSDGIRVLPWQRFLERLWGNEIIDGSGNYQS